MKDWINKLLSSDSGTSTMRVMALLCTITACIVALTIKDSAGIIAALLTPAFAGKALQKGLE
jgi:hypothetical protein